MISTNRDGGNTFSQNQNNMSTCFVCLCFQSIHFLSISIEVAEKLLIYNILVKIAFLFDIIKCKYYFHNGNNELPGCAILPLEK